MMKGILIGAAMASLAGIATAAIDGQIVVHDRSSWHGGGNGGPFDVTTSGFAVGGLNRSFWTFCLEVQESFTFGHTYDVMLNDKAVLGGVGGPNDPLDPLSAFLFYHATRGTLQDQLDDFNAAGGVAATWGENPTGALALQQALWDIEQETTRSLTGLRGTLQKLAHWAVYGFGTYSHNGDSIDNGATSGGGFWSGIRDVRVMNLFDSQGRRRQDLLITIPLPGVPGIATAGLFVLMWRRRTR